MAKVELFQCTRPCRNCPYRKDAPLQHWNKLEFEKVLKSENDFFGHVFKCHKNNGSACIGWLIKQDERRFPSLALRMELIKKNITRDYLDKLHCPTPLYEDVNEMIQANFPELLQYDN